MNVILCLIIVKILRLSFVFMLKHFKPEIHLYGQNINLYLKSIASVVQKPAG